MLKSIDSFLEDLENSISNASDEDLNRMYDKYFKYHLMEILA